MGEDRALKALEHVRDARRDRAVEHLSLSVVSTVE
jgi:hypothetical protein